MTSRPELGIDRGPTVDSGGSATRVRSLLLGAGAVVALVIVIAVALLSGSTPSEGAQVATSESVVLERPADDGWELLLPVAGGSAEGYPPPMVWRDGRVCVGFGRVDFGPDELRPSLARCEPQPAETMAANEIRSLVAVESGFDTWHFIEAADQIDSISLRLTTGETVGDDRLHLSGSTAALRLENDRDLASLRWSTPADTYRCSTDPTAWRTSEFCADPGDESTD